MAEVCSKCRASNAEVYLRYAKLRLCPSCFMNFYVSRLRKTVKELLKAQIIKSKYYLDKQCQEYQNTSAEQWISGITQIKSKVTFFPSCYTSFSIIVSLSKI